jgi:hypothetical protein
MAGGADRARLGAVLLVGAPGVGKSLLGRALEAAHAPGPTFSSVGDSLRAEGLVQRLLIEPTAEQREVVRTRARELVDAACVQAVAEDGCACKPQPGASAAMSCGHVRRGPDAASGGQCGNSMANDGAHVP